MVKFRNRVVHLYQEVNDRIVYEILQSDLEDFRKFVQQILAYLDKQPGSEKGR